MPGSFRVSRTAAFWLVTAALLVLMFAASAPSPLYVVYQARWHFSAGMLTTVFAVYAVFLLLALLTLGSLSDYLGRRPVMIGALVVEAAAMLVFAEARSVGWLLAARAVQGLATGIATGAIAAALVDLEPESRPGLGALVNGAASTAGLALGAFGSGLLVEYGPAPRVTVFVVLLAASLAAAVVLVRMPETVTRRPGAAGSLLPQVRIPRASRGPLVAVLPALVAVWALGGLYLSLAPTLAAGILHVRNHFVAGLAITTMMSGAVAGSLTMRGRAARPTLITGSTALAAGAAATLAALGLHNTALFFAATAVAGYGFGAAFLGALTTIVPTAAPAERAELFAALYVLNYLAFCVPAVIAGFTVPHAGLLHTAVVYGGVVTALALISLTVAITRKPPNGQRQPAHEDLPTEVTVGS